MNYSQLIRLLLFILIPTTFFAQDNWNEADFRTMEPTERYDFVHDYQFWKIKDINTTANLLAKILAIANEKKDSQTALATKAYIYLLSSNYNFKIPIDRTKEELKQDLKKEAEHLNKQDQIEQIFTNYLRLEDKMGSKKRFGNYKPLIVYRIFSKFYDSDKKKNEDLRFGRIVQVLEDSIKRSKGMLQFAKRQQEIEVDIYAEDLQKITTEKENHKKIRNIIFFILLLVILISILIFLILKIKNNQKTSQLNSTKNKLTTITQEYQKASSLIENLELKKQTTLKEEKNQAHIAHLISSKILSHEDWVVFKNKFEKVYPDFIEEQKNKFPKLTPAETRILVLEKLCLSITEIAEIQGVNKNTIYQTKRRLYKKIT